MTTYVVGHKNPDTDSIVSAIVYAKIEGGTAARAGEINKETQYILDRFGFEVPMMLPVGEKRVILVDTNGNPEEMAEGLLPEEVVGIADHHKLSGLKTELPIAVYIKPYGSTATLIRMFAEGHRKVLDPKMAGLLLSAIISDTLKFTSPITTEKDRETAEELAKIAGVDTEELAGKMFEAKSDVSDIPTAELLGKDYKVFDMGGHKVGIGVWETVLPESILERKEEVLKELQAKKVFEKLEAVFFAVVDILKNKSEMFAAGEKEKEAIKDCYGVEVSGGTCELAGIVSRKKQMIPPLEKYFAK